MQHENHDAFPKDGANNKMRSNDLVSLEMFENLHLQKHIGLQETPHYGVCGSLHVAKEASKGGHISRRLLVTKPIFMKPMNPMMMMNNF